MCPSYLKSCSTSHFGILCGRFVLSSVLVAFAKFCLWRYRLICPCPSPLLRRDPRFRREGERSPLGVYQQHLGRFAVSRSLCVWSAEPGRQPCCMRYADSVTDASLSAVGPVLGFFQSIGLRFGSTCSVVHACRAPGVTIVADEAGYPRQWFIPRSCSAVATGNRRIGSLPGACAIWSENRRSVDRAQSNRILGNIAGSREPRGSSDP